MLRYLDFPFYPMQNLTYFRSFSVLKSNTKNIYRKCKQNETFTSQTEMILVSTPIPLSPLLHGQRLMRLATSPLMQWNSSPFPPLELMISQQRPTIILLCLLHRWLFSTRGRENRLYTCMIKLLPRHAPTRWYHVSIVFWAITSMDARNSSLVWTIILSTSRILYSPQTTIVSLHLSVGWWWCSFPSVFSEFAVDWLFCLSYRTWLLQRSDTALYDCWTHPLFSWPCIWMASWTA